MAVYGIVLLGMGLSLFVAAVFGVRWLARRFRLPYALLTVGVITYSAALLAQVLLLRLVGSALLGILPIGALAIGLAAGFCEETARAVGFQVLARSTVTRPQALLIGAGHGLTETLYTGLTAIGIGLSLLAQSSDPADDLGAVLRGAAAESLNSLLPVLMHMALSWIVLQVFLRGELRWLFGAIFLHAVAEMTAALIGPVDAWSVVAWRALIAAISLALLLWIAPPPPETSEAGPGGTRAPGQGA